MSMELLLLLFLHWKGYDFLLILNYPKCNLIFYRALRCSHPNELQQRTERAGANSLSSTDPCHLNNYNPPTSDWDQHNPTVQSWEPDHHFSPSVACQTRTMKNQRPVMSVTVSNAEWENFQMGIAKPVAEQEALSNTSEATMIYEKDLFNSSFQMMESIRREGKLCDVTLKVGEHSVTAHRIVLAANVPYFRAMFIHNMVESRELTIPMSCIDSSALESLVNFAYTGRVLISASNVKNIMDGAYHFHLKEVVDACEVFLQVCFTKYFCFIINKNILSGSIICT